MSSENQSFEVYDSNGEFVRSYTSETHESPEALAKQFISKIGREGYVVKVGDDLLYKSERNEDPTSKSLPVKEFKVKKSASEKSDQKEEDKSEPDSDSADEGDQPADGSEEDEDESEDSAEEEEIEVSLKDARKKLDAVAESLGIENPGKLPNKEAVLEAIEEAGK